MLNVPPSASVAIREAANPAAEVNRLLHTAFLRRELLELVVDHQHPHPIHLEQAVILDAVTRCVPGAHICSSEEMARDD